MTTDALRDIYRDRARAIIYADLRQSYLEDEIMTGILADALARIDELARRGGGLCRAAHEQVAQEMPLPGCGLFAREIDLAQAQSKGRKVA